MLEVTKGALLFIELRKTSTPHKIVQSIRIFSHTDYLQVQFSVILAESQLSIVRYSHLPVPSLSRVSLGLWMDVRTTGAVRRIEEEEEMKYVPRAAFTLSKYKDNPESISETAAFRRALDRSRALAHRSQYYSIFFRTLQKNSLWKHMGQKDGVTMLSTGEKTDNAQLSESHPLTRLSADPDVNFSILINQ
ncbi:hypothetical protein K439DRAFT_1610607 [Ramaria rubella]|nr:hypothetical protein K439DRAFT_1610607 [Ramaria rubella]